MAVNHRNAGASAPLRAPGVYIEHVALERAPAFRTGVPVFVGFAKESKEESKCANHHASFCQLTCWEQFQERVGPPVPGGFLGYAVRGFFENGGASCVVIPLEDEPRPSVLTKLFKEGGLLEDIDDVDLICVPDLVMEEFRRSRDLVFEMQSQVLEHCKRMGDRFAILDALPVFGPRSGSRLALSSTGLRSMIEHWQALLPTFGALYFPWIYVKPLAHSGQHSVTDGGRAESFNGYRPQTNGNDRMLVDLAVPPCGHVAGIYARTDAQIGVHKAPSNEVIEGAMDLETELTENQQAELNEVGVNCLRSFPGRGIRVWGARTLSGLPNWRYVTVRRLVLTLVRWIRHNMNDLVFEPNEPSLWDRVRDRLGAHCYQLFERGALKGGTPAEAFFVKCDAEINLLETRAAGQLVCDVGLAPIAPAEFIVIRIVHSAAGTAANIPTDR